LRRLLILGVVTALATALVASAASAAQPAMVDVCHFNSLGEWQVNTLRDVGRAMQAHLDHGDGLPGDPVPGMADYEFDADCQPMLIPVPEADLSISKSDDVDPVAPGDTIVYTMTVHNAGPDDATNVAVTDTLPAAVTLVSTSGCVEDPNAVPTCTLGTIPAGGSVQYTVAVTVNAGPSGTITNSVSVTSDLADPNPGNNETSEDTTVQNPGIDIEKTTNGNQADDPNGVDVPVIVPGDTVTWTYSVTNTGDVSFFEADLSVTDSVIGVNPVLNPASDGGADGILSPGETWDYTAAGVADSLISGSPNTVLGCGDDRPTYENVGTVATGSLSDTDPSHYCNPLEVPLLAVAYTEVDGQPGFTAGDVLIAQLEDVDMDGEPSVGDIVRTNQYPLDVNAATFGSFGVTEHVITGLVSGTFYTSEALGMTVNSNTGSNQVFDWRDRSDFESYLEFNGNSMGFNDGLTGTNNDTIQVLGITQSAPDTLQNASTLRLGDQDFFNVTITPPAP